MFCASKLRCVDLQPHACYVGQRPLLFAWGQQSNTGKTNDSVNAHCDFLALVPDEETLTWVASWDADQDTLDRDDLSPLV